MVNLNDFANGCSSFRSRTAILITGIILMLLPWALSITYDSYPELSANNFHRIKDSFDDRQFKNSKRKESFGWQFNNLDVHFLLFYYNWTSAFPPITTHSFYIKYPNDETFWKVAKSTSQTLGCSLLKEYTTFQLMFLRFSSDDSSLFSKTNITFQNLQSALPDPYKTMDRDTLINQLTLAESCDAFSLGDVLYLINSDNVTITPMPVPPGWKAADYTESFKYGITDSCLYKTTSLSNSSTYQKIYTFDKYIKWNLQEQKGRIIATGSNATSNNPSGSNTFLQKIYVLQESSSGISLIQSFLIDGSSPYQNIIPIYISPNMTKIVYWNSPAGSNQGIHVKIKSIDYYNKQVYDIIINDLARFQTTFTGITQQEFFIGDYAIVMRNCSKGGTVIVQQVYQYVGSRLMFIASRDVSIERYSFSRIWIDQSNTYNILVVYVIDQWAYYQYYEMFYGTYADHKKIIINATNYIEFVPTYSLIQRPDPRSFSWASKYQNTQTTLQFAVHNPSKPNKIINNTKNLSTVFIATAAFAPYCRIIYRNGGYPTFIAFNATTLTITEIDLQPKINGANIDIFNQYFIARDCSKFAINGGIFSWNGIDITLYSKTPNFDWTAADDQFNYVVSGNSIWKLNSNSNIYVKYYNKTFLIGDKTIFSYKDRVIVASQAFFFPNKYKRQVNAYIDNGSTLVQVFKYDTMWDVYPSFEFSDQLTKVVIYGSVAGKKKVQLYSIDYVKKASTSIIFPLDSVQDEARYTLIKISQKFIYARQLWNSNKAAANTNGYNTYNRTESAYYLKDGIFPMLMFRRNITQDQSNVFKKALILTDDEGASYYLAIQTYEQILNQNTIIVRKVLLDPLLTQTGSLVVNPSENGVIPCTAGCSNCFNNNKTCASCSLGYVLLSRTGQCMPCALGCNVCNSSNPFDCKGCFNGYFLLTNSCLPCNRSCLTCLNNAQNCTSCKLGFFYDAANALCKICPRNCQNCADSTNCTLCKKGFVLTSGKVCRQCSIGCSDCRQDNITQCTACGSGLEMINSSCVSCPKNCIQCSAGICSQCLPGYSTSSAGGCRPDCQLPCASCEEGKPTVCTSCFSSSSLSNGTCVYNDSCNATGVCTDCGQGLNLFFRQQYCFDCGQIGRIPNCLQCSRLNTQACSLCSDGYYVDSYGSCPQCPENCTKCVSNAFCTSCSDGSAILIGNNQGKCIACEFPCLTCYGSIFQCLTCIQGFIKVGWKCLNKTRIGLALTLAGTPANVLTAIDSVVTSILQMLGENTTNVECVIFSSIVSGSVVVIAIATPISIPVDTASSNLQSALATTASVGGLTITSSSVTLGSGSDTATTTVLNLPLIIGVSAGILVLVCIAVGVVVYINTRQRNKIVTSKDEIDSKKPEREMVVVQKFEDSNSAVQLVNVKAIIEPIHD